MFQYFLEVLPTLQPFTLSLMLVSAISTFLSVHFKRRCAKLRAEVVSLTEQNRLQQALHSERDARLNESAEIANLQSELLAFRQKIETCYSEERREVFALKRSIESLSALHQTMNHSARELAQTLRGNSKFKGTWGELVLERVLEVAGLHEGRDFVREGRGLGLRSEDGGVRKPDVVVFLPRGRHLLIDSKLSLVQYEKLMNSSLANATGESGAVRQADQSEFIQSIKSQISNLAAKGYSDLSGLRSPDFVFLFVPIESAFAFIMEHSLETFEWASRRGIVLTSPSTLLSMLKMVTHLWKDETQNQNAQEISKRAGKLFDKFALCMADLMEIGKQLDCALQLHSRTLQRWNHGKGSLVWQVEELKRLGATASKDIPGNRNNCFEEKKARGVKEQVDQVEGPYAELA